MEDMKETIDPVENQPEEAAPKAEKATDKKKLKKMTAECAELQKKLTEAEEKLNDVNDKYLRMMAEYDNFRKRTAKEKESIYTDAYADCVGNILPILDNLERAGGSDNMEAVKKGLELTAKAFSDALSKMGITEIETNTFDPNLHNAVMHIEDETKSDGEIVEVFQKGYTKGERVIRYAMVKVAN